MLKVQFLLLFLLASCLASENIKDPSKDSSHHPDHIHEHDNHDHDSHEHDDHDHYHKKEQTNNTQTDMKTIKTDMKPTETDMKTTEKKEEEVVAEPNVDIPHGQRSRQFQPLYQPFFPQPSGGFNMIRRQFGGGMDLLGDIVMMGMIGLPILGLLTVGSSSIANFLGFGSKPSSKRSRRSLKEKAAGAVEYAKNLWSVMEKLERAFEKYDLYQAECRLLAVCEVHQKNSRLGVWGQTILDLMRRQKELEKEEILPVSRFIFSNYADAADVGSKGGNCRQLFNECPSFFHVSDKENEVE